MPPLQRQLPLPEMSAAQLARYRRALVRYLRRCREEQPQYQENDVIDVRLHAADAIVFLDFSPFRCAWRAIRRSPERADFWKWLLLYRRRSRPVLRQAVAEHAGDAELYVLPTPRAVRRFIAKIASGMPDSP